MTQIFCPMGLTNTEEQAFRQMHDPCNTININFYRAQTIGPGEPQRLIRYIEQRPELSVYVRVFRNVDLLSLPVSKRFGAFCYKANQEEPDKPILVAIRYAGGEEGIITVWRNKSRKAMDDWEIPNQSEYSTIA